MFGEEAICDFIIATKNATIKNTAAHLPRLGGTAAFGNMGEAELDAENFIHELNYGLRDLSTSFVIDKNANASNEIKAVVKSFEEAGLLATLSDATSMTTLAAMFYAYVEPVNKLVN